MKISSFVDIFPGAGWVCDAFLTIPFCLDKFALPVQIIMLLPWRRLNDRFQVIVPPNTWLETIGPVVCGSQFMYLTILKKSILIVVLTILLCKYHM